MAHEALARRWPELRRRVRERLARYGEAVPVSGSAPEPFDRYLAAAAAAAAGDQEFARRLAAALATLARQRAEERDGDFT